MTVQSYTAYLLLAFILLLEAEVFNLVKAQGKYDCQKLDEFEYCRNSSRIRVTKDKKDYRVRFCANNVDECMSDMVGDMNLRIKCSDVCDVCKSLPGEKGKINCWLLLDIVHKHLPEPCCFFPVSLLSDK